MRRGEEEEEECVCGEKDGDGDSDVCDDFCFVLALLPKEHLARFIAQLRRVARGASVTAFRAWRTRAGAHALRRGTLGHLLGTALEQVRVNSKIVLGGCLCVTLQVIPLCSGNASHPHIAAQR
jgi:hypothetical protein